MGKRTIYPSLEDFKRKAAFGNLVPVYAEIMADMETPVSAFRKVNEGAYSFLLESVEGGEKWARYSFIGFNPSVVFRSKRKKIEILRNGKRSSLETEGDPLDELKRLMAEYRVVKDDALPRFFGGAVGYIGYDMVRFFEKLPDDTKDDLTLNDSVFLITDNILIFDGLRQKIKVVVNAHLAKGVDVGEAYRKAQEQIEDVICLLRRPAPVSQEGTREEVPVEITSNLEKEAFEKIVLKAKDYIVAGDIIQVVLSQRFEVPVKTDPFNIYRALRVVNPSPYMYYLKL
jgi:anthranilate synthase component 1